MAPSLFGEKKTRSLQKYFYQVLPAQTSCHLEESGPVPVLEREKRFTQNECVVQHWLLWLLVRMQRLLCCWEFHTSMIWERRSSASSPSFRRHHWRRLRLGRGLFSCHVVCLCACSKREQSPTQPHHWEPAPLKTHDRPTCLRLRKVDTHAKMKLRNTSLRNNRRLNVMAHGEGLGA